MKIIKTGLKYFESRLRKNPFYVSYRLTRRCQYSCSFCTVRRDPTPEEAAKELSLEQIKVLASRLSQLSIPYVLLTGGEPLLRADIIDVVELFKSFHLPLRIQTNGQYLTVDLLEKLIEKGVEDFSFSIDSLNKTTNDYLRGPNALKYSKQSIELLSQKKLNHGITIVNMVLTQKNYGDVPELLDWVQKQGAYLSISPAHISDGDLVQGEKKSQKVLKADEENNLFELELEKRIRVFEEILLLKKQGKPIINSSHYLQSCIDAYKNQTHAWSCHAGERYIEIGSDGKVSPCSQLKESFNLLDDDALLKLRSHKFLSQKDQCGGCLFACYREVSSLSKPSVQLERIKDVVF